MKIPTTLAYWSPDEWGKFFTYFTQSLGNVVNSCIVPILTFYAGSLKGKSDSHGEELKGLKDDVLTLATNVPPPPAPPPGTTTTTTTTATTKPTVNQALTDTLPLGTPALKPKP